MYIQKKFIQLFILSSGLFTPIIHAMPAPLWYHSAGVVPYAVDQNNTVWILVGIEPARGDLAFDFGGKKDPEDKDNSAFTAAREGSEELLFLYDENDQDFSRILNLYKTHGQHFNLYKANSQTYHRLLDKINDRSTSFSSLSNGYMTYFVKISYRPQIPQLFKQRHQKYGRNLPYSWAEKSHLHWVKLTDLINALQQGNMRNVFVPTQNGTSRIHLFDRFAESLKAALQNGTLRSLK